MGEACLAAALLYPLGGQTVDFGPVFCQSGSTACAQTLILKGKKSNPKPRVSTLWPVSPTNAAADIQRGQLREPWVLFLALPGAVQQCTPKAMIQMPCRAGSQSASTARRSEPQLGSMGGSMAQGPGQRAGDLHSAVDSLYDLEPITSPPCAFISLSIKWI